MSNADFKILICDDISTMRRLIVEGLRSMGYRKFTEAEDAPGGWRALNTSEEPIRCVICDLNMPGGSGLDLLKQMRAAENFKSLPFIMLTASSEKESVSRALECGGRAQAI